MAEVNTDIYKMQGGGPLGTAQGAVNLLNTLQQNQILQQTQRIREYELRQAQTKGLIDAIGSVSSIPGTTREQILARGAEYMRATGGDPNVFHSLTAPLRNGSLDAKGFGDFIQSQQMGAGGYAPVAGPPVKGPTGVSPSTLTAAEYTRRQRAAGGAPQPTGLAPEEEAAQRGETTAGVAEKSADLSAAGDWQNKKLTQSRIIELLHKGGGKLQGLTTEEITQLKNLGVGYGMIDPKAAEPVEELRKYYQRNIETNSKATTDYSRAGAVIGNPNIKLTDASAKQLAMMDTIMARLRQAQSQEMIPVKSRDFISERARFNQNQDLYAYGMDMLGPKAQREHINSLFPANAGVSKMNDQQLRTFLKDADSATKDGKPLYPKWQKFRNSLAVAHKYEQMDLPQVSD